MRIYLNLVRIYEYLLLQIRVPMLKRKKSPPLDATPPSGIFVRTPTGDAFYIKSGKAYSVTEIHLDSWSARVIPVTAMTLVTTPVAGRIGFRDGTLVRDFGNGRIYLVSDSKKRHIVNPGVWESLGGEKETLTVSSDYLNIHPEGDPL